MRITEQEGQALKGAIEAAKAYAVKDVHYDGARADGYVTEFVGFIRSAIDAAFDHGIRKAKEGGVALSEEMAQEILDAVLVSAKEAFEDKADDILRYLEEVKSGFEEYVGTPSLDIIEPKTGEAPLDTFDFQLRFKSSYRGLGVRGESVGSSQVQFGRGGPMVTLPQGAGEESVQTEAHLSGEDVADAIWRLTGGKRTVPEDEMYEWFEGVQPIDVQSAIELAVQSGLVVRDGSDLSLGPEFYRESTEARGKNASLLVHTTDVLMGEPGFWVKLTGSFGDGSGEISKKLKDETGMDWGSDFQLPSAEDRARFLDDLFNGLKGDPELSVEKSKSYGGKDQITIDWVGKAVARDPGQKIDSLDGLTRLNGLLKRMSEALKGRDAVRRFVR